MWRSASPVALGVLISWAPARAQDAAPRATLAVERGPGTESCVEEGTLRQAVERRLERPVFLDGEGALRLSLRFERRGDRSFVADIALFDRRGTALGRRELVTRAAHCSALDDSLALVVALLVDSPEAREQAAAAPAPAATAPSVLPVPGPPATPLAIPEDVLSPREPYRWLLGASAAALVGPLPGVAFGPELLFAVRPPRFIELRLRPSLFPAREVTGPTPEQGGRLSLVSVALDLCPLEREIGRLRFAGCVGQSVGWVRAEGFGYVQNATTGSLVYSLGVNASALVSLAGQLGLNLSVGAALPLERDTYIARASDGTTSEVFRPAAVTGMLAAGLTLEL